MQIMSKLGQLDPTSFETNEVRSSWRPSPL